MSPVVAKVKAKPKFTLVKAKWAACAGFPSKVALQAKIDAADCSVMTGTVKAKKAKPQKRRFSATRVLVKPSFAPPATCAA